ncbi:hypothetical protein FACS189425_00200 [Clostridia bacterium]|nr:hypothetical protein FACS189425_00200 [Clostridia bacterium]
MRTIAIIPNVDKDNALINTTKIANTLTTMCINPAVIKLGGDVPDHAEMIIVLGGDGTILSCARKYASTGIPILGLNLGRLGFLAELEREDLDVLKLVVEGNYDVSKRMMLDVSHNGQKFTALNDIVVSRGSFSRIMNINIFLDDKFANSYTADGLIISTPTGSTAYSLSAGGPIVEPSMELMIITPICPHDLTSRSIIVPPERSISITIENPEEHEATLTIDGQQMQKICNDTNILINKSAISANLIRSPKHSFYDTLRRKLHS